MAMRGTPEWQAWTGSPTSASASVHAIKPYHHKAASRRLSEEMTLVLALSIPALFLLGLCAIYQRYRCQKAARERQPAVVRLPDREAIDVYLSVSDIEATCPISTARAGDGECCSICLMNIEAEQRLLPCHHVFHVACIDEWFRRKHTCPNCNKPVAPGMADRGVGGAGAVSEVRNREIPLPEISPMEELSPWAAAWLT